MLKKLHIKLTLICTIFTSFILIGTTVISLYFSEKNAYKYEYYYFLNMSTLFFTEYESKDLFSFNSLLKFEQDNDMILYCQIEGTPSYYTTLTESKKRSDIINAVKFTVSENLIFNILNSPSTTFKDFKLNYKGTEYLVNIGYAPNNIDRLSITFIHPLTNFNARIIRQRFIYSFIDLISIALLSIFSFFFSKKTIEPIIISRKKQNQFIAAASHELRLPLTVISTCTSAIKDASAEEQNRFMDIITSESSRMSRLVNDMLTLASANSNSWSINFNYDDIDTTLIECYEFFQLLAREKDIALKIDIPDITIPKCKYDKQRITQVLSILINNALSYTPKGGTIVLSLSKKDNFILLKVIDTGVGISDKDKSNIFEPFYRVDNSHNSKEHFGLGLSVAYEIIKLHKGNIDVIDTLGGGTTFVISLPI